MLGNTISCSSAHFVGLWKPKRPGKERECDKREKSHSGNRTGQTDGLGDRGTEEEWRESFAGNKERQSTWWEGLYPFYPLSSGVLSAISRTGYYLSQDSFTVLYLFLSLRLLSLYRHVLDVSLKKKVRSLPKWKLWQGDLQATNQIRCPRISQHIAGGSEQH